MNSCIISGTVAGDAELRETADGKRILNFDLDVDGRPGCDPIVRCGFFPKDGDSLELNAGTRVVVYGAIRHRKDRGFFVGVTELVCVEKITHSFYTPARAKVEN